MLVVGAARGTTFCRRLGREPRFRPRGREAVDDQRVALLQTSGAKYDLGCIHAFGGRWHWNDSAPTSRAGAPVPTSSVATSGAGSGRSARKLALACGEEFGGPLARKARFVSSKLAVLGGLKKKNTLCRRLAPGGWFRPFRPQACMGPRPRIVQMSRAKRTFCFKQAGGVGRPGNHFVQTSRAGRKFRPFRPQACMGLR